MPFQRARLVLVHDECASNDDQIIIYDLRSDGAKPLTLTHDEPEDYAHLHFSLRGGDHGRIYVQEHQYAGSGNARSRLVTVVPTAAKLEIRKGKWQVEK